MRPKVHLFWFRRDLRLEDNHGLYQALKSGLPIVPIYIFDQNILDELEDRDDRRVSYIHAALDRMQGQLLIAGSSLDVRNGRPEKVFVDLLKDYEVAGVFANEEYEPYARKRDDSIRALLQKQHIGFHLFKDQVVFEKNEVVKEDGAPYSVFTSYAKKWKSLLRDGQLESFETKDLVQNFLKQAPLSLPSLSKLGFIANHFPSPEVTPDAIIQHYHQTRNFPAICTSRMSVHLRFGAVSIRQLVKRALQLNEVFLNELIWREFFMQLLWHQPRLEREPCKKEYDGIQWRNNEKEFESWCSGKTGYPLVDAGMRELNATGFMHNRVRMVTASFLVKHLLINYRWGENWFARKLLDYELASNNGNWQWVTGCGCDAAPYFRIFNPQTQIKKFDPSFEYIRCWVPELDNTAYPHPIVAHELARERCLKAYKTAVSKAPF